MSELEALTSTTPTEDMAPKNADVTAEAFSFGDPIPVLDRRELLDYVECVQMDRWYEPPVSLTGWREPTVPQCITALPLR